MARIWSTEYLKAFDILGVDGNVEVISRGKVAKIKGLKHIFLDIFLTDSAEVVESFDVFQGLTDLRPKLI